MVGYIIQVNNPGKVMQFEKVEAGCYRSSCERYEIRRSKSRWLVWMLPSTVILQGCSYKAAKEQMQRLEGRLVHARIRPLRKSIPGHYLSCCGQFCFSHYPGGWKTLPTVSGSETTPLRKSYLAFHGIDQIFPTLKEAVCSLEQAVKVDPVEKLTEKAS